MKKLVTILILIVVVAIQAVAQVDYSFGNIKKKRNQRNVMTIGVKGGITSNTMKFSNDSYENLPGDRVTAPGYGVFVEYPISKVNGLSVGGELLMIKRGVTKDFLFRKQFREIDKFDLSYIDFRIPVTYYFYSSSALNPYVYVAADFAYCYSGEISKSFPDNQEIESYSIDVTKTDAVLMPIDISAVAGLGLRYRLSLPVFSIVFKLDASYNLGLLNTIPQKRGTPIDVYAYTFDKKETRMNRGFEVMFSIGLPLKFNMMRDACNGW